MLNLIYVGDYFLFDFRTLGYLTYFFILNKYLGKYDAQKADIGIIFCHIAIS